MRSNKGWWLCFFLAGVFPAVGQVDNKADSTKQSVWQKTQGFGKRLVGVEPTTPDRMPRLVLYRSLVLPGWGQATNRQYWKMGLVYGAAAGGVYGIAWNQANYKRTRDYLEKLIQLTAGSVTLPNGLALSGSQILLSRSNRDNVYFQRTSDEAYFLISKNESTGIFTAELQPNAPTDIRGPFVRTNLEPAVNSFRRQRDLAYIGFTAGWLLLALEAHVAAHLKTFDLTDDISLKFEPKWTYGNAGLGIRLVIP